MIPYHYTAQVNQDDAKEEADILGGNYSILPIASMVEAFLTTIASMFEGLGKNDSFFSKGAVLEKGQSTEVLEARKLEKSEIELLEKVVDTLAKVKR
jgi:hypothetical protein